MRRAPGTATAIALTIALGACGSGSAKPGASDQTPATEAITTAALIARGRLELTAGDLASAERDFEELVRRDPGNKFGFYNLGLIYQTERNNADGEAQYRRALAIDPKFGPALYNLAILRAAADDIPGAIALYRRAIAANPADANAHFNLGLLLRGQGKTAAGNREVQTAVNLDPKLRAQAVREGVPLTGS